jgi:5'-phosphate synthase pdxT subunit
VAGRVGILGFQGCIEPHEHILSSLGASPLRVRTQADLEAVDRLILPGGESTTMLRFIKLHGLTAPLQEFAKTKPVWGICAGSILAAREVCNPTQDSLNLIDVVAHRNFYGSQLDSFTVPLSISLLPSPTSAQFIRAPRLSPLPPSLGRSAVSIVAEYEGSTVFMTQGNVWVCSFHVELGQDSSLHELFLTQ